jgi:PDZ-binding kinase
VVSQKITSLNVAAKTCLCSTGTGVEVMRFKRSPKLEHATSPWAIKRIAKRQLTNENADIYGKRLTEEAQILKKLSHPNIVGFRNYSMLADGRLCLAMEDVHKSLGDILEERFESCLGPLPVEPTMKMVLDVAQALEYLHTKALLLHGDLKSFNVLVKREFEVCKLCDFGVSLPLDVEGFVDTDKCPDAQYIGTPLWSAPEVFEEEIELITSKCDMFSFGLVIYETMALIPPHTQNLYSAEHKSVVSLNDTVGGKKDYDENGDSIIVLDDSADLEPTTKNQSLTECYGKRPAIPDNVADMKEYEQIIEIFFICTCEEADERPSASDLVKALNF